MVKVYWNYEDMFCHVHADDSKKKSVYKCFESSTGCDQFCQELMNMYPRLKNAIGDLSEAKQERRIAMSMIERDGAILMDRTTKRFLLVKDAHHKTYMFPRGKINKNESPSDCLIRELKEEVNLDLNACWKQFVKEVHSESNGFNIKLLCFVGDFEDCPLRINCKKEISEIRWMSLDEICTSIRPNKQHLVLQFTNVLRKMLRFNNQESFVLSDTDTENTMKSKRNAIVNDYENVETFGITSQKDHMTVSDMLERNAQIEHRPISNYDGNPNSFGDEEYLAPLVVLNPKPLYPTDSSIIAQKRFSFDYDKLISCFCLLVCLNEIVINREIILILITNITKTKQR